MEYYIKVRAEATGKFSCLHVAATAVHRLPAHWHAAFYIKLQFNESATTINCIQISFFKAHEKGWEKNPHV